MKRTRMLMKTIVSLMTETIVVRMKMHVQIIKSVFRERAQIVVRIRMFMKTAVKRMTEIIVVHMEMRVELIIRLTVLFGVVIRTVFV